MLCVLCLIVLWGFSLVTFYSGVIYMCFSSTPQSQPLDADSGRKLLADGKYSSSGVSTGSASMHSMHRKDRPASEDAVSSGMHASMGQDGVGLQVCTRFFVWRTMLHRQRCYLMVQ